MEQINEYLKINGLPEINLNTIIYNGYSLRYIIKHFNKQFPKHYKIEYLTNCIKIYCKETLKIDLTVSNQLRNRNFFLTQHFLNN